MEIAGGMIYRYLAYITEDWIEENGVPASDMNEYYDQAIKIKGEAEDRNDLEPLRLGFDYLLCHPEISLENHGASYGWADEEVREAIRYIRKTIFVHALPLDCNEVKSVKLVQMGQYDWWKMRTTQGLHPDFSKQTTK